MPKTNDKPLSTAHQAERTTAANASVPRPGAGAAYADIARSALERGLLNRGDTLVPKIEHLLEQRQPDQAQEVLAQALGNGCCAERALDTIRPLFRPGEIVELRALSASSSGTAESLCGDVWDEGDYAALLSFIKRLNGRSNLYFGVNPREAQMRGTARAARASNVTLRRAFYLDMDAKDAPPSDPAWSTLQDELQQLEPILLVNTGNGFHAYFEIEEVAGEALGESVGTLKDIMARTGSDNVADLPRISRLPFTVNLPTKTKLVRGAVPRLALPANLPKSKRGARPLAVVCTDLHHLAARLVLPGRKSGKSEGSGIKRVPASTVKADGPSTANSNPYAGYKGEPAPSLEVLRIALAELPNQQGGHFDDRAEWMDMCHAIKGAALNAGIEDAALPYFLNWSGQWENKPYENRATWNSIRSPGRGWGYVMQALARINPQGYSRVWRECGRAAFAAAALGPEDMAVIQSLSNALGGTANVNGAPKVQRAPLNLTPVVLQNATSIPPRAWLYGRAAVRGFLTMIVAPGGTGKSGLAMGIAVAMAAGKVLFGADKPHGQLKVWSHSAEDPLDEQRRRLAALCTHHGITDADLSGHLILTSARDKPLCFARMGSAGPEIVREDVEATVEAMTSQGVDVLIVDPVVGMGSVPENDNTAVNLLMTAFREIAERTQAAVIFLHHTSKQASLNMDAAGVTAARGADAFQAAARIAQQLVRMTADEARRFGILEEDRHLFFRVENGKANMAPLQAAKWFRLVSVPLNNGTAEYPDGDTVAVVENWNPPGPITVTSSDLHRVQVAISTAPTKPRAAHQAADWVGWLVADALGLDAGRGLKKEQRTPEQQRNYYSVCEMIDSWLRDGGLLRNLQRDPKGNRDIPVIEVGEPAMARDLNTGKAAA